MQRKGWNPLIPIVILLAAVAAFFAPRLQAAEPRVVAVIEETFEVNGEVFTGGTLSLRHVGPYNPATTIKEICVDEHCVGVLLASAESTMVGGEDALLFERASNGHLVLVGFRFRGESHALFGFRVSSPSLPVS